MTSFGPTAATTRLAASCWALLLLLVLLAQGAEASSPFVRRQEQLRSYAPAGAKDPRRQLLSLGKAPGYYEVTSAKPTYRYVVPLKEEDLYSAFQQLNAATPALPVVHSVVTVAVSANQTVIWYDHHEDGYDEAFAQTTTMVWGDGNAANGCRPDKQNCADEDDILYLGDVFSLEDAIAFPRDNATLQYDSGDTLYADYPLTIARAYDAEFPSSEQALSGAVEVDDDSGLFWGQEFTSPVGPEFATATGSFGMVKMFLLSGEDNNLVTFSANDGNFMLQTGDSIAIDVNLGDIVSTTGDSLAHLVTADLDSTAEMRSLSLLPSKKWSNQYIAPVGDETGNTNVLVYNPGTSEIIIDFETIGPDGEPKIQPLPVPPKSAALSPCVGACCESPCPGAGDPRSGAKLQSQDGSQKFAAFSVTNVRAVGTPPFNLGGPPQTEEETGEAFDWGCPLIPASELTNQAHISLGDLCRGNDCGDTANLSSLWISPVADADVFIDRRHMGSGFDMVEVDELGSVQIDMDGLSGAIVFATEKGSGAGGYPVNFAGAWGRNAAVPYGSYSRGGPSFKGGMTLLPYNVFGLSAKTGPGTIKAGEEIEYEILIENLGPLEYGPGEFLIHDDLPVGLTFVEGSMEYSSTAGSTWVTLQADAVGETTYQLDEAGLASPDVLPAHGGVHMIRYTTIADDPVAVVEYNNEVDVSFPNHEDPLELDWKTTVNFTRKIRTKVSVYEGNERDGGCDEAEESVVVLPNTNVTFCVSVKNNGKQPLTNVNITSPVLGLELGDITVETLAPGKTHRFTYQVNVPEKAVIIPKTFGEGNPVFFNMEDIWTLNNVKSNDGATAEAYNPSIAIDNKVSESNDCSKSENEVAVYDGEPIWYCLSVTNTGNSFLSDILVEVPGLNFSEQIPLLARGENTTLKVPSSVTQDLVANATVVGFPSNGETAITELAPEYSSDMSTLTRLTLAPSATPSASPSEAPTISPAPSAAPSSSPTGKPSSSPSTTPTASPSTSPTSSPSAQPTMAPSAAPSASPTGKPSGAPSTTPTESPSSLPTASPSAPPTLVPTTIVVEANQVAGDTRSGNKGGGGGDPHFKTWSGQKFDYHGECDLVLVDVPSFANGRGLRVHIRTKRRRFFSYIERAALQIGDDILEFANREEVFYNGKKPSVPTKFAGYQVNTFQKAISVRLDEKAKAKIDFITRKSGTPYVVIDGGTSNVFKGGAGLIGTWPTGDMMGRNNSTDTAATVERLLLQDDPDAFATEWQVRDTEPLLFRTARAPQYPVQCIPPARMMGNRLGDSHMKAAAAEQCAAWAEDKEECMFDVMATRDIRAADDPVSFM